MKKIVEIAIIAAFLLAVALTVILGGCAISQPTFRETYTTNANGSATSIREVRFKHLVIWPAKPIATNTQTLPVPRR